VRRGAWIFGLEPPVGIDVGENAEASEPVELLQAIEDAVLAPRIRTAAIDNIEPAIEALQRLEGWQVGEQMALGRRQLDTGDYQQTYSVRGFHRSIDIRDFVVNGKGDDPKALRQGRFDDRLRGHPFIPHIVRGAIRVDVHVRAVKRCSAW